MSKKPEKIKAKIDPLVDRLNQIGKRDAEIALWGKDWDDLIEDKASANNCGFYFQNDGSINYRGHQLKRV